MLLPTHAEDRAAGCLGLRELESHFKKLNLSALTRGESSRPRRDTLDEAGRRQSYAPHRPWPARYPVGIASIPVLTHGILFRDKATIRMVVLPATGYWQNTASCRDRQGEIEGLSRVASRQDPENGCGQKDYTIV